MRAFSGWRITMKEKEHNGCCVYLYGSLAGHTTKLFSISEFVSEPVVSLAGRLEDTGWTVTIIDDWT